MPDPGSTYEPAPEFGYRLARARAEAADTWVRNKQLREQTERVLAETRAIQQVITEARRARRSSPDRRGQPQHSEYARLLARLETMPVIEQAKGIIMAQSRCGEAEAFDILRRASQRFNVPVRELAAGIVGDIAGPAPGRVASQDGAD